MWIASGLAQARDHRLGAKSWPSTSGIAARSSTNSPWLSRRLRQRGGPSDGSNEESWPSSPSAAKRSNSGARGTCSASCEARASSQGPSRSG